MMKSKPSLGLDFRKYQRDLDKLNYDQQVALIGELIRDLTAGVEKAIEIEPEKENFSKSTCMNRYKEMVKRHFDSKPADTQV